LDLKHTSLSYVSKTDDIHYLANKRNAQKFSGSFSSSGNELSFARKVLLVEGPGDKIAVSVVCEKLGKDPDAEDYSVIECGGKSQIPFYATTCSALAIPHIILYDEDVFTVPEGATDGERQQLDSENAKQIRLNAEISRAGRQGFVFACRTSLEAVLGIGRNASEKPRKVAEAITAMEAEHIPEVLRSVVESLFSEDEQRE
jgi:predicted ATP-dependent endonuclease of OLD family